MVLKGLGEAAGRVGARLAYHASRAGIYPSAYILTCQKPRMVNTGLNSFGDNALLALLLTVADNSSDRFKAQWINGNE